MMLLQGTLSQHSPVVNAGIDCRRHESSRPMKIVWELERPMPGRLCHAGKMVAGYVSPGTRFM